LSIRVLLVLFVVLTVLGITVLLLDEGPVDGGGGTLDAAPVVARPGATPLPPDAVSDPDGAGQPAPLIPDGAPDPASDGLAEGLGIHADGSVTGRVVDPSGAPLEGVPVLLYVVEDPWQDDFDGDLVSLKIGATRSDGDGAFVLPARSGATHTLFAGGIFWSRVKLGKVAASDRVLVRLENPLSIEGFVRDEETGDPVEGAHVLVIAGAESLTGTTDVDGAYRVAPVPYKAVNLAAWAPGYDVGVSLDALPGWEPVFLDLPAGRDVVGRTVERETREPVAGAEVVYSMDVAARVAGEDQPELESRLQTVFEQRVVSDADGMFVLEGVSSSGFELNVSAEGFIPKQMLQFKERILAEEEEITVTLRLLETIRGRVVQGVDQVRVPGATVELSSAGQVISHGAADETGGFSFELDGWDGRKMLYVTAFGRDGLRGVVAVPTRASAEEVVVRLADPVPLSVRVTAGDSPLAGAQVSVHSGSGPDDRTLVSTGADGMAVLVHPRSSPDVERLILQARYAGEQSLEVEVDLTEGLPDEPILLDVETGLWVEGTVMDAFGSAIPGASVWARRAVGVHADFDGRFRLGPLEEGRKVVVRAVAQGFHEQRETIPELSAWVGELLITLEPIVVWEGRVTDSTTGLPVEEYLARLQKERDSPQGPIFKDTSARVERVAGEPGTFIAELPSPGRYRVKVVSMDYIEASSDVLVFDGATQPGPLDVIISPAAVLLVTVLDSLARPVPGFSVRVVDQALSEDPKTRKKARKKSPNRRTDGAGTARFNLGEGGAYRLASGSTGWLEPGQLSVTPGPVVEHAYRLPATGDLALRLTDEFGEPISRPRVTVRSKGKKRAYEVLRRSSPRNAPDEVFFDVLPPGEYSLRVRARGFESLNSTAVVVANRLEHVRLVLRPASVHRGR
jgi:protocatechuate 3,4-dioxygenase beta subunit